MLLTYFIYIIGILIIFLIILLFSNIEIQINILRINKNDNIAISLSIFQNLLKYEIKIPLIDLFNKYQSIVKTQVYSQAEMGNDTAFMNNNQKENFNLSEIMSLLKKARYIHNQYSSIILYLNNKITIHKLLWETKIGLDNAAVTAIFIGFLWGLKSNIILFIKSKYHLEDVHLNIIPCYTSKRLDIILDCIVTIKIGYIIYAGIKLIFIKIRGGDMYEGASH